MITFDKRLRDLRNEKRISRNELAEVLDISREAISKWEIGRNYPNQEVLNRLSNFFNVSADYLLGNTDIREKPEDLIKKYTTLAEYKCEAQANKLAKRFATLKPVYQAKLDDYLRYLEFCNSKTSLESEQSESSAENKLLP